MCWREQARSPRSLVLSLSETSDRLPCSSTKNNSYQQVDTKQVGTGTGYQAGVGTQENRSARIKTVCHKSRKTDSTSSRHAACKYPLRQENFQSRKTLIKPKSQPGDLPPPLLNHITEAPPKGRLKRQPVLVFPNASLLLTPRSILMNRPKNE